MSAFAFALLHSLPRHSPKKKTVGWSWRDSKTGSMLVKRILFFPRVMWAKKTRDLSAARISSSFRGRVGGITRSHCSRNLGRRVSECRLVGLRVRGLG